jgi:hypothetical protein
MCQKKTSILKTLFLLYSQDQLLAFEEINFLGELAQHIIYFESKRSLVHCLVPKISVEAARANEPSFLKISFSI